MADGRDDPRLFLVDPDERGILPLDDFHVPKRLAKTVRAQPYRVSIDTAFRDVLEACASPRPNRVETWINQPILEMYDALHRRGVAHSVECWRDDVLVGGLYGVRLGGAFFGESMFSSARDASKIALVHLVAHLIAGGFQLLDTQFVTAHLAQFGTITIARADYRARLAAALNSSASFPTPDLLEQWPAVAPPMAQARLEQPLPQQQDLRLAQPAGLEPHLIAQPQTPQRMQDVPPPSRGVGQKCLETIARARLQH
jgi:leucyl/phenylalanyl-tRNA--protein transferase